MKTTLGVLTTAFLASRLLAVDMVVDKTQYVLDHEDNTAYYFDVVPPSDPPPPPAFPPNVFVWGSGGWTNAPEGATNVISLSAGRSHLFAYCADGKFLSWGVSNGLQINLSAPDPAFDVAQIASGPDYDVVVHADGIVNVYGQFDPVLPSGLNVFAVAPVTTNSMLYLMTDGTVQLVGTTGVSQSILDRLATITNAIAIAGAPNRYMVLLQDQTIVMLGYKTNVSVKATTPTAIAASTTYNGEIQANASVVSWISADTGINTVTTTNAPTHLSVSGCLYGPTILTVKSDGAMYRAGAGVGLLNMPLSPPAAKQAVVGSGFGALIKQ